MIQKQTFSVGGFGLHNIPYRSGKLSAWFDKQNNLVDVEYILKSGKHYRVTDDAKRTARMMGNLYKDAA